MTPTKKIEEIAQLMIEERAREIEKIKEDISKLQEQRAALSAARDLYVQAKNKELADLRARNATLTLLLDEARNKVASMEARLCSVLDRELAIGQHAAKLEAGLRDERKALEDAHTKLAAMKDGPVVMLSREEHMALLAAKKTLDEIRGVLK